jgi:membrane peptidoglycan carboxypeptidase
MAAGKTGTTDEKRNAWFVGYTPQLVAAVWMGDPAAYTPMLNVGKLGAVFGGTYPAIIWQKFMSTMLVGTPLEYFLPPDPNLWPQGRYVSENGRTPAPPRTARVHHEAGSVLRRHPRRPAGARHAAVGAAGYDTTDLESATADAMSRRADR